jgi:hypothetical protein
MNNNGSVEQDEANRLLGENRAVWNTAQPASLSEDHLYDVLYAAWRPLAYFTFRTRFSWTGCAAQCSSFTTRPMAITFVASDNSPSPWPSPFRRSSMNVNG